MYGSGMKRKDIFRFYDYLGPLVNNIKQSILQEEWVECVLWWKMYEMFFYCKLFWHKRCLKVNGKRSSASLSSELELQRKRFSCEIEIRNYGWIYWQPLLSLCCYSTKWIQRNNTERNTGGSVHWFYHNLPYQKFMIHMIHWKGVLLHPGLSHEKNDLP